METTALPCCRRISRKGREQLIFETAAGQRITMDEAKSSVTIEDTNGNSIQLTAAGIVIQSAVKLTVNVATAEINASTVSVNAGMMKVSGVLQADTVITNSVVANTYTPGAGNIM